MAKSSRFSVRQKSMAALNGRIFYKAIYQEKGETKSNKYAKGNYYGDNSFAYFRRKEEQNSHSRSYKEREHQIKSYLFNNLHLSE